MNNEIIDVRMTGEDLGCVMAHIAVSQMCADVKQAHAKALLVPLALSVAITAGDVARVQEVFDNSPKKWPKFITTYLLGEAAKTAERRKEVQHES